jgi:DNA-binding transcriptional LysR family regulator
MGHHSVDCGVKLSNLTLMESLSGLTAFVRTAETLSFVAAGRLLGISASAVGKNVAKLEQGLGVQLFQRSTRRVGLTAEGALFYERCRRILDDLQRRKRWRRTRLKRRAASFA